MEENKPQVSNTPSEAEFSALMGDFAEYLKAKESPVKKRKILAQPTEQQSKPSEIKVEDFSNVYQKPNPEPNPDEPLTPAQKAQLVMDEIEKLVQVIESHKTK